MSQFRLLRPRTLPQHEKVKGNTDYVIVLKDVTLRVFMYVYDIRLSAKSI